MLFVFHWIYHNVEYTFVVDKNINNFLYICILALKIVPIKLVGKASTVCKKYENGKTFSHIAFIIYGNAVT